MKRALILLYHFALLSILAFCISAGIVMAVCTAYTILRDSLSTIGG